MFNTDMGVVHALLLAVYRYRGLHPSWVCASEIEAHAVQNIARGSTRL